MGPHDVYWGSHGCCLATEHKAPEECECDCCECGEICFPQCVAKPPHYGPELVTNYYGEDVP